MAAFSQTIDITTSPPFSGEVNNTTDNTYAAMAAGLGTNTASRAEAKLTTGATPTVFSLLSRGNFGFDLTTSLLPYDIFRATAATLRVGIYSVTTTVGHMWTNDNACGIGLTVLNDATKANNTLEPDGFQAIRAGGYSEVSSRLPFTSCTPGSAHTFTINQTGLDYINTVRSKAAHTNYAFFGICFGGEIDSLTPTWGPNAVNSVELDSSSGTYPARLNITYEAIAQINIGDVWKDVSGIKINVGDVWKDVVDLNINIGDVWK